MRTSLAEVVAAWLAPRTLPAVTVVVVVVVVVVIEVVVVLVVVNIAGGRPRRRLPLSGILELEIFKFGIKLIHRVKNIEFRCLNCKIDFQSDPSNA